MRRAIAVGLLALVFLTPTTQAASLASELEDVHFRQFVFTFTWNTDSDRANVVVDAKDLTLDHILPRAQGGESTPANLVTACVKCNQRKGNRTPEQARMPLLTSQKLLRLGLDHVLLCHYAESRPEWKKYLFMDDHEEEKVKVAA